jgi:hypothetical protein
VQSKEKALKTESTTAQGKCPQRSHLKKISERWNLHNQTKTNPYHHGKNPQRNNPKPLKQTKNNKKNNSNHLTYQKIRNTFVSTVSKKTNVLKTKLSETFISLKTVH